MVGIVWYREDLRLADQAAVLEAMSRHSAVAPIYIMSPGDGTSPLFGTASYWWLLESLRRLNDSLRHRGSRLIVREGDPGKLLLRLALKIRADTVYWNRRYGGKTRRVDCTVASVLQRHNIRVRTFAATLLHEPGEILNRQGKPYRVFTPYWKRWESSLSSRIVSAKRVPEKFPPCPEDAKGDLLEELWSKAHAKWHRKLLRQWEPGEVAAEARLGYFIEAKLEHYEIAREQLDGAGTSALSPYLHFGEISPQQIVRRCLQRAETSEAEGTRAFLRQLAWREFSYSLLFHHAEMPVEPLFERFRKFPWREDDFSNDLNRWKGGITGIPVIDAGMRQLWDQGWMSNRVRMLTASFLSKNLLIPWQKGSAWFLETLVDADLANNSQGWQWVAGCGIDAAPYFRIFNPVVQGQRYDPLGSYIRVHVPELGSLPAKWIHRPWNAPPSLLKRCGIQLGVDYPSPICDLRRSRERALRAYASIRL